MLAGTQLTFTGMVTSSTRISLPHGVTVVADKDRGIVKVRPPKEPKDISAADLASVLTALPVHQVLDQESAS